MGGPAVSPELTRRGVLAGLAATGLGSLALGSVGAARRPPYTRVTYASAHDGDNDDRRVRVAWYETYNGSFLEATNGSTETDATLVLDPAEPPAYELEATGPVIRLENVLPGDSGTLVVGLLAEELAEVADPVEVWFRPTLGSNGENGVTEPELHDPTEDDPGDGSSPGELADALQVTVWLDDGELGACDGALTPMFEGPLPGGDGTLADVVAALGDGRLVTGCLPQGSHRCLGLAWSLPWEVGNAAQTDTVTFDLAFVGQDCGLGNPFAGGDP